VGALLADRPEQQPAKAAVAARPYNQKIGAFCLFTDGVGRLPLAHNGRHLDSGLVCAGLLEALVEHLLGLLRICAPIDRNGARSPRKRSTEWIETALSRSARLHTLSQGW
jgi:hypothetical protein